MVTDFDCWHDHDAVSVEMVIGNQANTRPRPILSGLMQRLKQDPPASPATQPSPTP